MNSRISGGDGDGGAVRWQACRIGSRCGDDVGGGDDNGGGGVSGGGDDNGGGGSGACEVTSM